MSNDRMVNLDIYNPKKVREIVERLEDQNAELRKLAQSDKNAMREINRSREDLKQQIAALNARIAELEKALKGRHDYGPASPAEQEFAWVDYCSRSGWEPNSHPSAKNAFVEGFCMGDMFSEGDETVELLRKEINGLVELLRECREYLSSRPHVYVYLIQRIATALSKGEK